MSEETGAAAPVEEQGATTPAPEAEKATAGEQASAVEQTKETIADNESGSDDSGSKPNKVSGYQRQKIRAERNAAIALEERIKREEVERKLEALSKPSGPKPEDYPQGEYDPGYLSELAATKAASRIEETLRSKEEAGVKEKADAARREIVADFEERASAFKILVPDFDEAISSLSKAMSFKPHVAEELFDSDAGPSILYHLAKSPQKAQQLNEMSPREVAKEIGRLEATLTKPQQRKQTQAGAPLASIGGGAAPPTKDPAKMSTSEYVAWRKGGGGGKPAF